MADNNELRLDVEGNDVITDAIMTLINQYPAMGSTDEISFSMLDENNGIAMYPVSGAIIQSERISITGHVHQECAYPFFVIFRSAGLSEERKMYIKEWLDNLGRWLEKQQIKVGTATHKLAEYPELTGGRRFKWIGRKSPAAPNTVNPNGSEDWVISMAAVYECDYYR